MPTKRETPTTDATVVDVRDLSVHFDLRGSSLSRLLGRDTGLENEAPVHYFAIRAEE